MIDPQAFGAELAAIVKGATAPLIARIDALEKALAERPEPAAGRDGRDGADADPEAVAAIVHDRIKGTLDTMQEAMNLIPEMPELPDIPSMIEDAVAKAVEALPQPESGKDGISVTVEEVLPSLEKRVDQYLASIPAPKDGVDGKDGAPGERGEPGRDGLDVKDLFRAEGGRLVAVMSDGRTKDLGVFVGADGRDGADGKNGSDGRDGLGFDDLTFEISETGRPMAKFSRGGEVKTVSLPGIIDRGQFNAAAAYEKGDAVSYGGSLWLAQEDGVTGKPGSGDGWRLAVKKGRDGRDASVKKVP
ncbi:hypothetical protein JI664_12685 [Rhodobacter sp. NTK016B]|uniref:hypothetical protein n=1 Tax=Rhodobacter sp. NTK016B TaxID=2759676 RepID=UPI001A8C9359|nr:hypothetical protein [Rhodobacter sp. NTK016B]MBN8292823.1 hypothetical protein [Rhodobacter sp. NTK016B]